MTTAQSRTSALELLSRMYWMIVGPLILIIPGYLILEKGNGWLTPPDIAFLLFLTGMPVARWIEFQYGRPRTTTGEPATQADLNRYVIMIMTMGLAVWVAVNLIGNFATTRS